MRVWVRWAFVHLNICPGPGSLAQPITLAEESRGESYPRLGSLARLAPPGLAWALWLRVLGLGRHSPSVRPESSILFEFYRNCFDCMLVWGGNLFTDDQKTRRGKLHRLWRTQNLDLSAPASLLLSRSDRVFRDHKQTVISRHKAEWVSESQQFLCPKKLQLSLSTPSHKAEWVPVSQYLAEWVSWVPVSQHSAEWVPVSQHAAEWVPVSQHSAEWFPMSQHSAEWVPVSQQTAFSLWTAAPQQWPDRWQIGSLYRVVACTGRGEAGEATLYKVSLEGVLPAPGAPGGPHLPHPACYTPQENKCFYTRIIFCNSHVTRGYKLGTPGTVTAVIAD